MVIFNIVLILFFFWMSLYTLSNLTKLDVRFYELDLESINFQQYLYYLLRFSYFIWLLFGLFSNFKIYFLVLFSFIIFKFFTYFISKKTYLFFNVVDNFLVIFILIILLFLNIKSL